MPVTVLNHITWDTYECLLKNYENSSAPRLAYDRGTLEVMSPLIVHEETNRALAALVERIAEEWGVRYRNLGSTTFKRQDMERGFEPDSCFYIQNLARISGRRQLDLAGGDPPPDLVIEVDVTSESLSKLPILVTLGVPEVWRVTEDRVTILVLQEGVYQEATASIALPALTADVLNDLLAQSRTLDVLDWVQAIRTWARQNLPVAAN